MLCWRLSLRAGGGCERMLVYRAAYALAGANAYSDQGDDGHFAWCVGTFERSDVRRVLGGAV